MRNFSYWKRWIRFYVKYNLKTKRQVRLEKLGALDGYRLNIVLPKISSKVTFGGITTALRFFHAMRPHFPSSRIIVLKEGVRKLEPEMWQGWELDRNDGKQTSSIKFLRDRDAALSVSPDDVFIATHWQTAILVKTVLEFQSGLTGCPPRPFVYFIQDFEPAFYNWSDEYLLADSTYRSRGGLFGVFSTGLLRDYFVNQGYAFDREYSFDPKIHPDLMVHARDFKNYSAKEKIMLIYGRPTVARNCFDVIVDALKLWVEKTSEPSGWKIISAGDEHPPISLGRGCEMVSVGKLTIDEYASYLMNASIGISLLVSPHPSYTAQEMASFGLNVITNCFANKDISSSWPNVASLREVNPSTLASEIEKMCSAASPDPAQIGSSEGFKSFCSEGREFAFAEDLVSGWLEACGRVVQ